MFGVADFAELSPTKKSVLAVLLQIPQSQLQLWACALHSFVAKETKTSFITIMSVGQCSAALTFHETLAKDSTTHKACFFLNTPVVLPSGGPFL